MMRVDVEWMLVASVVVRVSIWCSIFVSVL